jgi:hypothetical protein
MLSDFARNCLILQGTVTLKGAAEGCYKETSQAYSFLRQCVGHKHAFGLCRTCSPSLEILSYRFAIHQQIGSECLAESSPKFSHRKDAQFFLFSVPSANVKLFQQQVDNGGAQA